MQRTTRDERRLRWSALTAAVAIVLAAACTQQAAGTPPRSSARAAPTPTATLQPCVPAQADTRAAGVSSAQPVLQLAAGLNQAEDLLVQGDQVLVGEFGSGQIVRLGDGAPVGGVDVLPAHVPEVEGLAAIGSTLYAADQADDRIVTVSGGQVTPFYQLQPVRGLEGVDGIAAAGSTLIVPDSPRGVVLFIGQDGQVQRRVGGFARPTGAWPLPDGSVLIADENAASVSRLAPDGTRQTLATGVPLADDVVQDAAGRVYAISIGNNDLVQVANGAGTPVASGLKQPQGLGVDGAGNLVVTEYDAGRVDSVVMTFELQPPLATGPSLGPNQPLCVQLDRAPGFQDPVSIEPGAGYRVVQQPGTGSQGSILPTGCTGPCRVQVTASSGARTSTLTVAYQR